MRYYSSTAVEMALTGSVNEIVTTLVVDTVLGLPAQTPFTLVLDVGLSSEEIVTVTGVSGTNLTVTRGVDGSSAIAHTIGALTRHMVTARDLREPQEHLAATANVHGIGATASVVGTSTTQTLTNKTINFADNTTTAIPQASVTDLVDNMANAINPIGTVLMWAGGATAPTGYLVADGTAVSRTTYSALFAVIGTTHGVGDGSSTFGLPNMAGRVVVGIDAGQAEFNALGEKGGEKTHLLTAAEMPSHTHIQNAHTHTQSAHNHTQDAHNHTQNSHTHPISTYADGTANDGTRVSCNNVASTGVVGGTSATQAVAATNNAATATNNAATAINASTTATNQSTGGGGAHNNLQPYIVLRYIIKT